MSWRRSIATGRVMRSRKDEYVIDLGDRNRLQVEGNGP
jgi:hypothetical protein